MSISLLDYLNAQVKFNNLNRKKLSVIMRGDDEKLKEETWKIINNNGGYEALLEGDDFDGDIMF